MCETREEGKDNPEGNGGGPGLKKKASGRQTKASLRLGMALTKLETMTAGHVRRRRPVMVGTCTDLFAFGQTKQN